MLDGEESINHKGENDYHLINRIDLPRTHGATPGTKEVGCVGVCVGVCVCACACMCVGCMCVFASVYCV